MTENDGGTRRLTENALEEAPSGTVSEAGIADIVTGVLAGAVDGTLTVAEALKRIHSAELCKAVVTVDATETTIACYDEADTDVVITLTVQNDFSGRTKIIERIRL